MNLSILETVNAPETIAPEEYVAPTDFSAPIDAGDVTLRVIDGKFKDRNSGGSEDPYRLSKDRNGNLMVELAVEVVDGPTKGKRLYTRVGLSPFKNGKGNSFFNFLVPALRGVGIDSPALSTAQDYIKGLDKAITKGAKVVAYADQEWYCNDKSTEYQGCGLSTKGQKLNAPKLPNGQYDIRIGCPGTAHEDGNRPVLLARNTLSKFRQYTSGVEQPVA